MSDRFAKTIWYISKYTAPVYAARANTRGFLLLREFAKLGHRCCLITSDANHLLDSPPRMEERTLHESSEGVDVYWLRTLKFRSANSIRRVLSWIDFEIQIVRLPKGSIREPDVVIVSSLSLLTVLNGLRLKKLFGCRLVFEVRDIWPLVLVETGGFNRWNPFVVLLGWIEKLGYRHSDIIVGTMPNLGEHVTDVLGELRPVECVPQGLDEELLEVPESLGREYIDKYLPAGKFIVCYAGSIGADNAMETMVECAREMKDRSDILFLIVGEGYLKDLFERQVEDLDNIIFAPGVPKKAVQSVLSRASLLYFSANDSRLWRFGQSLNKLIDYMISGKPILASYSGFPSMINEADCGSIVPAGDVDALRNEILRYSEMDHGELSRIGTCGRDWVIANRRFDVLAARYISILSEYFHWDYK